MASLDLTANSLSNALLVSQQCASSQEAAAIADAILQEVGEKSGDTETNRQLIQKYLVQSLQDYFGLELDEARGILRLATSNGENSDDDDTDSEASEEESNEQAQEGESDDDNYDGELIGEGECELCERLIMLTKHHLIPKSTHAHIKPKLLHATTSMKENDLERARRFLGPGLEHVMDVLKDESKWTIRRVLQQTCDICRPCHTAVHMAHDNMTLALNYNTVEQLLEDEQIYKFCQWASKQKAGKYAVKK